MQIFAAVNQIIMLFLIAGVGILLRRIGVLTDPVLKGLNQIVVLATQPALSILTTQRARTPESLRGFLLVTLLSTVILSASLLLARFAFRKKPPFTRGALLAVATLPNVGFIGMPVMQAMFGDGMMLYLAGYIIGFNLAFWSVGVMAFEGFSLRSAKGLLNPGFLGSMLGTALFLLGIALPAPLLGSVTQIAQMNTPIAMLLLGARLVALRPRHLADGRLWGVLGVKMLAQPLIVFFALRLLGFDGMVLGVLTVGTAMPVASLAQIMCERCGADVLFAAKGISVSTLLCIATIPIVLGVMSVCG